ncbi:hypothetical protein KIN20_034213 [Parelaphostrongylus tenuis]|uniref:Uncharacterized protein n=1 Tax=Parelaphostrongylus tenuis TaxID=148309 RepID=A0AAD5R9T4_PARTN|nr:hypothetical protein KIN20_034213 [Parelaphostrongylus tenuis]
MTSCGPSTRINAFEEGQTHRHVSNRDKDYRVSERMTHHVAETTVFFLAETRKSTKAICHYCKYFAVTTIGILRKYS